MPRFIIVVLIMVVFKFSKMNNKPSLFYCTWLTLICKQLSLLATILYLRFFNCKQISNHQHHHQKLVHIFFVDIKARCFIPFVNTFSTSIFAPVRSRSAHALCVSSSPPHPSRTASAGQAIRER